MSETKFTPGPWVVSSAGGIGPRINSDDQSNGMISPVAHIERYDWPEVWRFNARLIAAAPELYRLLDEALSYTSCESWSPSLTDEIEAALVKARGEG